MSDLLKKEDGAYALFMVGLGVAAVFLIFRMYCRWKFKQMVH
jgi:hypothetical protein